MKYRLSLIRSLFGSANLVYHHLQGFRPRIGEDAEKPDSLVRS